MSRRKPLPDIKAASHEPDGIDSAIKDAIQKCLDEGVELSPARAARKARQLFELARAPGKGSKDAGRPGLDSLYRRAVHAIIVAINTDEGDGIEVHERDGLPCNLGSSVPLILSKVQQAFNGSDGDWWTAMWLEPFDDDEEIRRAVGGLSRMQPASLLRRMRRWRAKSAISPP